MASPAARGDAVAQWVAENGFRLSEADHAWVLLWVQVSAGLEGIADLPDELDRLLRVPLHPLLARLPLDGETPGAPPSGLARHGGQLLDAMIDWVDAAFDGVLPPDEDHKSLREAQACDERRAGDRSGEPLGRWQDLPDAYLLDNQEALPHLDAQGVCYYLPAVMRFFLRHRMCPHPDDRWLTESLEYTLACAPLRLRAHQEERLRGLTAPQRRVIHAVSLFVREDVASAWRRALDGPPEDWFRRFSPPPSTRP